MRGVAVWVGERALRGGGPTKEFGASITRSLAPMRTEVGSETSVFFDEVPWEDSSSYSPTFRTAKTSSVACLRSTPWIPRELSSVCVLRANASGRVLWKKKCKKKRVILHEWSSPSGGRLLVVKVVKPSPVTLQRSGLRGDNSVETSVASPPGSGLCSD